MAIETTSLGLGAVAGGFADLLPAFLIGAAIFVIGFLFLTQRKFNIHGVFCRVLSDGRKQYFTDKAKKIKLKNGVIKWRWKRLKVSTEPAPEDVQEINMKGQIVVQAYVTKENTPIWRKDETKYDDLVNSGFKPVTNDDRRAHAYEMEQAYNHLNGLLQKYGPLIASGFVLVIILVVFMVFFGKTVQPAIDMQAAINEGKKLDLQILGKLEELDTGVKTILEEEVNAARTNNTEVAVNG